MYRSKSAMLMLAIFLLSLAAVPPSLALTRSNQARGSANEERLLSALDKSGYSYSKVDKGIWVIELDGKHLAKVKVIIAAAEDVVVVSAEVIDRKELKGKEAELVKMLELNDQFDTAKLALSKRGLYARTDIHAGLVDGKELAYLINQVAALADDAYAQVKP
jgi:hypothetical protein